MKGAIISLSIGTVSLVVTGCVVNYFVMIPAYVALANFPLETILGMASKVNGLVTGLESMIIFAVAPFNLVKGVACSVINLLLYKRLSKVLHI
jgi:riboflavin transporter FmnP